MHEGLDLRLGDDGDGLGVNETERRRLPTVALDGPLRVELLTGLGDRLQPCSVVAKAFAGEALDVTSGGMDAPAHVGVLATSPIGGATKKDPGLDDSQHVSPRS